MNTISQVNKLIKQNLHKIIFLLLFISASTIAFSQSSTTYFFPSTTEESLIELKEKIVEPEKYSFYLKKIEQLENEGKVILSTQQYYYIKLRIDNVKENPQTEEEMELKSYVKSARVRYVSISDLIK